MNGALLLDLGSMKRLLTTVAYKLERISPPVPEGSGAEGALSRRWRQHDQDKERARTAWRALLADEKAAEAEAAKAAWKEIKAAFLASVDADRAQIKASEAAKRAEVIEEIVSDLRHVGYIDEVDWEEGGRPYLDKNGARWPAEEDYQRFTPEEIDALEPFLRDVLLPAVIEKAAWANLWEFRATSQPRAAAGEREKRQGATRDGDRNKSLATKALSALEGLEDVKPLGWHGADVVRKRTGGRKADVLDALRELLQDGKVERGIGDRGWRVKAVGSDGSRTVPSVPRNQSKAPSASVPTVPPLRGAEPEPSGEPSLGPGVPAADLRAFIQQEIAKAMGATAS